MEAATTLWTARVIRYTATLTGDRVSSLSARVHAVDYLRLKAVATHKYGAPTAVEAVIVESRFGGKFQTETSTWRLAQGVIRATQRTRQNIDEGELFIATE
jgi:hypothetical protein